MEVKTTKKMSAMKKKRTDYGMPAEIHDTRDPMVVVVEDDEEKEIFLEPRTSEPLGLPLPRDEHACSVSLPSWASVVGYEEGDENITSAMRCGYPRFVYHPLILQLMAHVVRQQQKLEQKQSNSSRHHHPKEDCLLLPGYAAAVRCQAFLQQALEGQTHKDNALLCTTSQEQQEQQQEDNENQSLSRIRIVPVGAANVHAVLFPAETPAAMQAKAYWQHTGEIVSSRRAEQALKALQVPLQQAVTCGPKAPYIYHPASLCGTNDETSNSNSSDTFTQLRQRIAEWTKVPSEESVFLTPSGMASIYTALRSARRYQMQKSSSSLSRGGGGRSIVYGFPYLDTLKLCSRKEFCPDGVHFFGYGNAQDLQLLKQVLQQHQQRQEPICALFTEVPSNPLLQCPDLKALRHLADEYDFALIVDDTIGNFLNLDMIHTGIADAVCTSLTKIVSGRGDAMAGSIVVNPHTVKGRWMQRDLQQQQQQEEYNASSDSGLFEADAHAVLCNSRDFVQRNQTINQTSEVLADWLDQHDDVERVYYPKYAPLYPSLVSAPNAGYGGLMSILLESHMCQRSFYDSLNVPKGPSLGTNFTLVCPYTLLAHYHELDFAMSYNVPPNLLRISVGLEDVNLLKDRFEEAFAKSRLYPKLKQSAVTAGGKAQHRAYSTMTTGYAAALRSRSTAVRRSGGGLRHSTLLAIQSLLKRVPR